MLFFLSFLLCFAFADLKTAYVLYSDSKYSIIETEQKDYVAKGEFDDLLSKTGWTKLSISTNGSYPDEIQAYGAGYLESYLTYDRIYDHAFNFFINSTITDAVRKYYIDNDKYIKQMTSSYSSNPFWYQTGLMVEQEKGLVEGYDKFGKIPLSRETLKLMMYFADISDLNSTLSNILVDNDHCSALIKIIGNNEDVYIAQDSWYRYHTMTRIWKVYDFKFHTSKDSGVLVPGQKISFSSYPTYLFSFDDFYMVSSGLVVQETTFGNSNTSLFNEMKPQSVAVWIRTMLANRLSTNGKDWGKHYGDQNNGCYCNQYMILNMNLFKPKEELDDGLLYLVEQIPALTITKSITHILRNQSYFPSYNSAYFPEMRIASNSTGMEHVDDYYTYYKNPRAKIFARDQHKVTNLLEMRKIMRYNNFEHDELSKCNCTPGYTASFAIAMRGDLNKADGKYPVGGWGLRNHGALDVKLTSYSLFIKNMTAQIISGPTNDNQPTFQFSTSPFSTVPHRGLPDKWDFPWYTINSDTMELKELGQDLSPITITGIIILSVVGGLLLICIAAVTILEIKKKMGPKAELPLLAESSATPNTINQPLMA